MGSRTPRLKGYPTRANEMADRFRAIPALCALCVCLLGSAGSTAGQLPTYPAAKPGDAGYVAEDPQLARLVGRPGPAITLRLVDGGTIDITSLRNPCELATSKRRRIPPMTTAA